MLRVVVSDSFWSMIESYLSLILSPAPLSPSSGPNPLFLNTPPDALVGVGAADEKSDWLIMIGSVSEVGVAGILDGGLNDLNPPLPPLDCGVNGPSWSSLPVDSSYMSGKRHGQLQEKVQMWSWEHGQVCLCCLPFAPLPRPSTPSIFNGVGGIRFAKWFPRLAVLVAIGESISNDPVNSLLLNDPSGVRREDWVSLDGSENSTDNSFGFGGNIVKMSLLLPFPCCGLPMGVDDEFSLLRRRLDINDERLLVLGCCCCCSN